MSFLRKMYAQVRLDSDVPASGATVDIMRVGCRVTGGTGGPSIQTDNPGGIRSGSRCYAIDSSGNKISGSEFQCNQLLAGGWYSSGSGTFVISWSNDTSAGFSDSSWARIVLDESYTDGYAEFYQTDTAADTPLTETITLNADGVIEGYVKVRDVDLILKYNGVTSIIDDVSVEKREFVTPEDFGAFGDGTSIDEYYIANALDYLSYVAGGGELRLGPNSYRVLGNRGLTIDGDNVSIVGQGAKSKLICTTAVGNAPVLLKVNAGADDILFRDFAVEHTATGTSLDAAVGAIQIGESDGASACKRIMISGIRVKSRAQTAIALYGVQGFTIINCTLSNGGGAMGGHGIGVWDTTGAIASKRGIISACQLYDNNGLAGNSAAGVYIDIVDRVMIDGCSIRGWDYGVHFAQGGASNDLTIDSCHIRNQSKIGIYTATASQVDRLVISGNTVDTCGEQGIYLDSSGLVYSPVIDGNTVSNTGKSGIVLDNCYGGVLSNNVVSAWNTDNDGTGTATKSVENGSGYGFFNAITGMNISGNVAAKFAGGAGSEEYAYGFATGATGFVSHGNSIQGSMNTADYYFETPANAASSSWLNDDPTTGDWLWGDPDGSVGRLKPDGSIDMGGGALDTEGGGILSGGGTINTEGGNVEIGDGQLINATGSNGWVNLGDHWDDVQVPGLTVVTVPAGNPPTFVPNVWTNGAGSAGAGAYSFSATAEEEVFFEIQLPHGYKEGSDIYPHVHWAPSSTNTGNVVWGLEYTAANVNGTFGNTTLIEVTDAADGTTNKHQATSFAAITGTSFVASTVFICRLYRKAADAADTFTGETRLVSVDFHIQKNSIGSDAEFTKA